MRAIAAVLLMSLTAFLGGGCAPMESDVFQTVDVDTPNSLKAHCTLTNDHGIYEVRSTPGHATIRKSFGDLVVFCRKNGESMTARYESSTPFTTVGRFLIGGIITGLMHANSGLGYSFPDKIVNQLTCRNLVAGDAPAKIDPATAPLTGQGNAAEDPVTAWARSAAQVRASWAPPPDATAKPVAPPAQSPAYGAPRDPDGNYKLGMKFFDGAGVARDTGRGIALLAEAAKQGDRRAPLMLGIIHLYGWGGQVQLDRAKAWFVLARQAGAADADYYISLVDREMTRRRL
jgi:hypothetical protein